MRSRSDRVFCVDEFARILAFIFIAPHRFGRLQRTQRIQTPTRGRTRLAGGCEAPVIAATCLPVQRCRRSLVGDSLRCQLAQPMWPG